MKMARVETTSERLSYCNGCEHNKLGICKRCGCIIQGKTRLAGSFCPIGLWGKEDADQKFPEMKQSPNRMGLGSFFKD